MRRTALALAAGAMLLSACATSPDKIAPAPVSAAQYENMNCDQIKSELIRVSDEVGEVTGQQRRKANKDKVLMGVGIVVFWPALLFMIGGDKHDQLAHLKGEYDGLVVAANRKSCPVVEEMRQQQAMKPTKAVAKH